MGTYIGCGVITHLEIKKEPDHRYFYLEGDRETALDRVSRRLDTSLFQVAETDRIYRLSILPEVFREHIHGFLNEQFAMIYELDDTHAAQALLKIKDMSFEQMMALAAEGSEYYFQECDGYGYTTTYKLAEHDMYYRMVLYFMEGKAMLECYNRLFSYLDRLIGRSTENPLKGAVLIDLIG